MLEFYAPWCPACKQFASTWQSFSEWTADTDNGIRVGKVDVTAESTLSGQFMVTQLPTIFHIHDGEVRPYSGKRTLSALQTYVDSEWQQAEPVPWWRSPTTKHMRLLGVTYWLSQKGKELQSQLEEEYELPTYAVFIIIAIATIIIGLGLGGITVFCIEVCIRLCSRKQAPPSHSDKSKMSVPQKESNKTSDTQDHKNTPQEGADTSVPENPVESPNSVGKSKTRKRKTNKAKQEEK